MVAGDFETTRGPWGIRGEAAYFPEDTLQLTAPLTPVPAKNLEIGAGMDMFSRLTRRDFVYARVKVHFLIGGWWVVDGSRATLTS